MSTTDISVFFPISLPKNRLTTKQWKKCFVNQAACTCNTWSEADQDFPHGFWVLFSFGREGGLGRSERRGSMPSLAFVTVFHKLLSSL